MILCFTFSQEYYESRNSKRTRRRQPVKPDYIEMGLREGKLVFELSLNGRKATLTSPKDVADDLWHKVIIFRQGNVVLMQLDSTNIPASANAGSGSNADFPGRVYLGKLICCDSLPVSRNLHRGNCFGSLFLH